MAASSLRPLPTMHGSLEKYHQQMLVINGVDLQTNSHTTGVLHNWSGRNAAGYPALTALTMPRIMRRSAPMAYVNFGGFGSTENLISYTKLQGDPGGIAEIVEPNLQGRLSDNPDYEDGHPIYFRQPAELSLIEEHRQARLQTVAGPGSARAARSRQSAGLQCGNPNAGPFKRLRCLSPQGRRDLCKRRGHAQQPESPSSGRKLSLCRRRCLCRGRSYERL